MPIASEKSRNPWNASAAQMAPATGPFSAQGAGHRAHSYTSLKRRTSRIEIMFITSVMTNRVAPTAKIVL